MPGVYVNLSKSGASLSLGPRGATGTIGPQGLRGTLGMPGTGLFYTVRAGGLSARLPGRDGRSSEGVQGTRPNLGFLQRMTASVERRALVEALQAWHDGHEVEARRGFETVATSNDRTPDRVDAAWLAALMHLAAGDAKEAARFLNIVESDLHALGTAVAALDVEPIVHLEVTDLVVIHVPPTQDAYHLAAAEVAERMGEHARARRHLETLVSQDALNPLWLASWGDLIVHGPHESADLRDVVARMASLQNDSALHAVALLAKGRALSNLGLFSAARDTFTMVYRNTQRPSSRAASYRPLRARPHVRSVGECVACAQRVRSPLRRGPCVRGRRRAAGYRAELSAEVGTGISATFP